MLKGSRRTHDARHLNLTCADCGARIAGLPFAPRTDRPVYCQKSARNRRRQNPQMWR